MSHESRARLAVALLVLVASGACGRERAKQQQHTPTGAPQTMRTLEEAAAPTTAAAEQGHLGARPGSAAATSGEDVKHGLQRLGLRPGRDALLYVPTSYRPERPAPLVLMLHGAGGDANGALAPLRPLADAAGLLLLAPESLGPTWDVIVDSYGPDVAFIDRALAHVFARYAVDPERLAVEGFSDGASYALSLGLSNGELFTHVLAFSPGFMVPTRQQGRPSIYVSHGTRDGVLPIDRCSRRLVPRLEAAGYDVQYVEFDGPHTVPAERVREALQRLTPGA